MVDTLVGTFQVESRENYDGFMKGVGVPDEYIEAGKNAKVITKISKNGDAITIARDRPKRSSSNTFKLGEETEIDTIKGDKAKVTVNVVGGKLVAKGPEYNLSAEIVGGKLKEVITLKGHTMVRTSVRV